MQDFTKDFFVASFAGVAQGRAGELDVAGPGGARGEGAEEAVLRFGAPRGPGGRRLGEVSAARGDVALFERDSRGDPVRLAHELFVGGGGRVGDRGLDLAARADRIGFGQGDARGDDRELGGVGGAHGRTPAERHGVGRVVEEAEAQAKLGEARDGVADRGRRAERPPSGERALEAVEGGAVVVAGPRDDREVREGVGAGELVLGALGVDQDGPQHELGFVEEALREDRDRAVQAGAQRLTGEPRGVRRHGVAGEVRVGLVPLALGEADFPEQIARPERDLRVARAREIGLGAGRVERTLRERELGELDGDRGPEGRALGLAGPRAFEGDLGPRQIPEPHERAPEDEVDLGRGDAGACARLGPSSGLVEGVRVEGAGRGTEEEGRVVRDELGPTPANLLFCRRIREEGERLGVHGVGARRIAGHEQLGGVGHRPGISGEVVEQRRRDLRSVALGCFGARERDRAVAAHERPCGHERRHRRREGPLRLDERRKTRLGERSARERERSDEARLVRRAIEVPFGGGEARRRTSEVVDRGFPARANPVLEGDGEEAVTLRLVERAAHLERLGARERSVTPGHEHHESAAGGRQKLRGDGAIPGALVREGSEENVPRARRGRDELLGEGLGVERLFGAELARREVESRRADPSRAHTRAGPGLLDTTGEVLDERTNTRGGRAHHDDARREARHAVVELDEPSNRVPREGHRRCAHCRQSHLRHLSPPSPVGNPPWSSSCA